MAQGGGIAAALGLVGLRAGGGGAAGVDVLVQIMCIRISLFFLCICTGLSHPKEALLMPASCPHDVRRRLRATAAVMPRSRGIRPTNMFCCAFTGIPG